MVAVYRPNSQPCCHATDRMRLHLARHVVVSIRYICSFARYIGGSRSHGANQLHRAIIDCHIHFLRVWVGIVRHDAARAAIARRPAHLGVPTDFLQLVAETISVWSIGMGLAVT